jgi:hypothetical protein
MSDNRNKGRDAGDRKDVGRRVRDLIEEHGTTYAAEAGIRLADKPSPLYQLHVLATLLSARISAAIAVAAARELFAAGNAYSGEDVRGELAGPR